MKHAGYEYEVKPVLELTRDEVQGLCAMATLHYDVKCRSFGKDGGLLRGFQNLFQNGFDDGTGVIKVSVTHRELDTLCKIAEQASDTARWDGLREALDASNEEWKRLNETKLHPDMEEALKLLTRADNCPTPGHCACRADVASFVARVRPNPDG